MGFGAVALQKIVVLQSLRKLSGKIVHKWPLIPQVTASGTVFSPSGQWDMIGFRIWVHYIAFEE